MGIWDDQPILPKHKYYDINLFEPQLSLGISDIYTLVDKDDNIIGLMETFKCSIFTPEIINNLITELNTLNDPNDIQNIIINFRAKYCDGFATYLNKL